MGYLETLTWVLGHRQRGAAKHYRGDTRVSAKELEECMESDLDHMLSLEEMLDIRSTTAGRVISFR